MDNYKSIWNAVNEELKKGKPIYVNLNKKNLYIGKTACVKHGIGELPFFHEGTEEDNPSDSWGFVEQLYETYKRSLPCGKIAEESRYFKAGNVEDIEDILKAPSMYRAKTRLEAYVLLAGLEGDLEMPNPKHYFWQSEKDKDLVVLRKWIVKEKE